MSKGEEWMTNMPKAEDVARFFGAMEKGKREALVQGVKDIVGQHGDPDHAAKVIVCMVVQRQMVVETASKMMAEAKIREIGSLGMAVVAVLAAAGLVAIMGVL